MLVTSANPYMFIFQASLLSRGVGVGVGGGGWGKVELKLTQSPARIGAWAELGKNVEVPLPFFHANSILSQYHPAQPSQT